jgi:hypothetical protein
MGMTKITRWRFLQDEEDENICDMNERWKIGNRIRPLRTMYKCLITTSGKTDGVHGGFRLAPPNGGARSNNIKG